MSWIFERLKSHILRESREQKSGLDDTQEAGDSSRVVLVIVALALVFIGIITYFVVQMPPKP